MLINFCLRFDLVYLLLDKPDEDDDRRLASHIVSLYISNRPVSVEQDYLKIEKLTKYINYARNRISPEISEKAGDKLVDCYVRLRHMNTSSAKTYTATTRQLESLIRLSEAYARMRYLFQFIKIHAR